MKKPTPKLNPREWDFENIDKEELETCFLYEYGRQLTRDWPWLRKKLSQWRVRSELPTGHAKQGGIQAARDIQNLFRKRFGDFPWVSPEVFPDFAWQGLTKEWRSLFVESVNEGLPRHLRTFSGDRLSIHTLRELKEANVRSVETFTFHHEILCHNDLDQTEYGFFSIDWNYDDPEIKTAFGQWVTAQRKEREKLGLQPEKKRKKSRGGFKDRLRRLGALRITRHYARADLAKYPDTNLEVDAPYSHLPDLYQAAKKAECLLQELRWGKSSAAESAEGHESNIGQ